MIYFKRKGRKEKKNKGRIMDRGRKTERITREQIKRRK